jgi:hypothetical protein
VKGTRPLLSYLQSVGVAPAAALTASGTPSELLIDPYSVYLLQRRGLSRSTVRNYSRSCPFAVAEEIVEYNAAAAVPKPRYERARELHIFMPADVEQIRRKLDTRDAMHVSLLAYSRPRPEKS